MNRSQQSRREDKRRRHEQRKRKDAARTRRSDDAPAGDLEPLLVVLAPPGREPPRIEVPAERMSDALVSLMEPFIPWPPAPDELALLEAWLLLGAAVWNHTVGQSGAVKSVAECAHELASLVEVGRDEMLAIIDQIAARKRRLFPSDLRFVVDVRVVEEAPGRARVLAAGAWYARR